MRYIVSKGFIAIDGTSLTICDVNKADDWFTFMMIAHTQNSIIVPKKVTY
jgi:riboflavin synthase